MPRERLFCAGKHVALCTFDIHLDQIWSAATEVIYVVKADETPYPLARQGVRKLQRVGAPLIGIVLNQLDVIKADRYYGEYSGYGRRYYNKKYGYGYTGKK